MRYSLQGSRRWLSGALLAFVHTLADAASPELTVSAGGRTQKYTADTLLAHASAVTITVPNDVSYKRAMTYRAVPASVLLAGLPRDDSVRFVAADGFAATIAAAPLLSVSEDTPRAYLAVEPPAAAWPALKPGSKATAGPFYLVWLRPEKGRIVPEQWPYQIARVEAVQPVAIRFPALAPGANVQSMDPIRHGFAVFSANCLPCHTLNLAGDANVGPDLNVPFSPTEYMREDFLRQQIRNPQSLRVWPGAKMPGFDVNVLSERDLDNLIAYLYYMSKRKVEVPKG
jgi:mono/diheme cytochrome c family protein